MGKSLEFTNEELKRLALALLEADGEQKVIAILRRHRLWDDSGLWRNFGDTDNNYSTIGNQQSRPEAALVEKLVNCVDSRLLNECLARGIDPESSAAPQSIREAVARFFEDAPKPTATNGLMRNWPATRQLEQARHISVAVTGARPREGDPCLTIVDLGEGQTPARVPDTFLSLDRRNKQRIAFVQGKFNMGGTGALKFCGKDNLQLLITRRNPALVAKMRSKDPKAEQWAVTVVRRERPLNGTGGARNSIYKYLAPIGADSNPGKGEILSFRAGSLPLMAEKNEPYKRAVSWGSAIKLYEYEIKGKSHALRPDGLLGRMELLLPGVALPIRVHECRDFRGHEGSFENTLVGLSARLEANRAQNLEEGYPTSVPFTVNGERMVAQIYAFKPGKADTYRSNEGVIFVVNGQTHGSLPKTFFERKTVRMQRLASSLLIAVDCSDLTVGAREDLFMNSRDRLSNGPFRWAIEDQLEDLIGRHPGLRELQERRRNEELREELSEAKPLEEVIDRILKSSPSLARLFLLGQRVGKPFRGEAGGEGGGRGKEQGGAPFRGKRHPTFFKFHRRPAGESIARTAELGRKCRIKFETDVENEYFSRSQVPGRYVIEVVDGPLEGQQLDSNVVLFNGIANWSISFPENALSIGDEVAVQCTVMDDALVEPFVNLARIRFVQPGVREGGKDGKRDEKGSGGDKTGTGMGPGSGGSGQKPGGEMPMGIQLPRPHRVHKGDEAWKARGFDEFSACTFVEDAVPGNDDASELSFYVNVDNRYLQTDLKEGEDDASLREAKFVYGNVLVALALIHSNRVDNEKEKDNGEESSLVKRVEWVTRAMAPFLVPMIDSLGGLSEEEVSALAQRGDDE